ncbi:hypothetical protein BDR26DRAFT_856389 [Obelidium mucronatum]|nr:hypothetical protein BDR26DRAFT_856389 [Obelidium mucronatum]
MDPFRNNPLDMPPFDPFPVVQQQQQQQQQQQLADDDVRALSYALLETSNFNDHWLIQRYSRYAAVTGLLPMDMHNPTGLGMETLFGVSGITAAAATTSLTTPSTTDSVAPPPPPAPQSGTAAAADAAAALISTNRKRRKPSLVRKANVPSPEALESMSQQERRKVVKAIKKKERELSKQLVCFDCGATSSPFWRKTEDKVHSLCNACGIYFKKHKKRRLLKEGCGLSTNDPNAITNSSPSASASSESCNSQVISSCLDSSMMEPSNMTGIIPQEVRNHELSNELLLLSNAIALHRHQNDMSLLQRHHPQDNGQSVFCHPFQNSVDGQPKNDTVDFSSSDQDYLRCMV